MDTERPKRDNNTDAGRASTPRAFLGARDPVMKAILAVVVLAIVGLGGYRVYDRYVLEPRRQEAIHTGDEPKLRYAHWQRMGPKGWNLLFEEAAQGLPGYMVDTGLPARLKLIELGHKVVDVANAKLDDPSIDMRITAVLVLAAVGEPQDRTADLLVREVRRARTRADAVKAMKCASAIDKSGPVIERVVFVALLESPFQKAREVAGGYLHRLYLEENADPALRQRVDELKANADPRIRIELVARTLGTDPLDTDNLLLEMLGSADEETRRIAADYTAEIRDGDPIGDKTTPDQIPGIIERHRCYLKTAIAVARVDEDWRTAFRALDEGVRSDNEAMALGMINLACAMRGMPVLYESEQPKMREPKMADQRRFARIGAAAANCDEDPVGAYTALLEGLNSPDGKTADDVADIVRRLREIPLDSGATAQQREWVRQQLDLATAAGEEPAETVDEAAPQDTSVEGPADVEDDAAADIPTETEDDAPTGDTTGPKEQ